MVETTPNDAWEMCISRRAFLRIGTIIFSPWLLPSFTSIPVSHEDPELSEPPEEFLQPELVHNVEVYGLNEKITSEEQITRLYAHLDEQFAIRNDITIGNKVEQRKVILNPNERYLEVVVNQSAYDSFLRRHQETQVDFVEWIQMHVDAINRCMENAKPPSAMKAVLRRIIVIDDNLPDSFYDKIYEHEPDGAFDWKWATKFKNQYPIDTDTSWAIAYDYRVDQKKNTEQGYFWSVRHQNGKTIFGWPPGATEYKRMYEFPEKDDSLGDKNGVWLDFGLTHEWSHYLLNLPDEYSQDVHNSTQRYQHFLFKTGLFQEPRLSPYLSYFAQRNIELRLRGAFTGPRRIGPDRPENISVTVADQRSGTGSLEVRRVRRENNRENNKDAFGNESDQWSDRNEINFDEGLFEGNSNCWLIRWNSNNGTKEIYLPAACFSMSKSAKIDTASYQIEFTEYENQDKKTQIVELVDESDVDKFLKDRADTADYLYAKMKVDGTNTWFVWFLR